MITEVFSAATFGVDAYIVRVETHVENGLFAFAIVRLPDSAVKESKERVAAAIKNNTYLFPIKRYTINPVSYTHLDVYKRQLLVR